jgi:nitroreductase
MSIFDLIKNRRSVRSYSADPISDEILYKVLEAGRMAPSACNYQPWLFIVIKERENRLRLSTVYNRDWFFNAPVILCVCCNRNESWHRKDNKDFGDIDIAISVDHMTLTAQEAGLGTCWIGNFDSKVASQLLKLPPHIEPVVFTPLGYPHHTDSVPPKIRKSIDDIVYFESYRSAAE